MGRGFGVERKKNHSDHILYYYTQKYDNVLTNSVNMHTRFQAYKTSSFISDNIKSTLYINLDLIKIHANKTSVFEYYLDDA